MLEKKELIKELTKFRSISKILAMKSNVFSITISPKYELSDPKYLFEAQKEKIQKALNRFSSYYILYPEFGVKNTAQPRLHYHGVIKIKDRIKLYKTIHLMQRELGFTKMDPISDHNNHLKWLMYCQKEYASTQHILPVIIYKNRRRRLPTGDKISKYSELKSIPPYRMDIKQYYKYLLHVKQ